MDSPLRIGLSARLMYPDPQRTVLPAKNVHYAEENAANWLMGSGALVFVIPRVVAEAGDPGMAAYQGYADALDGLVLQGGADLAPQAYGERPLRPEWAGDPARDAYELALFAAFRQRHKPILGICRGCQLLNVALGGSLYQDLGLQLSGSGHHRHETRYDANYHAAEILPGTGLAATYGGARRVRVNSIHHQAIRQLGAGLVVEARSEPDGVIEAVRAAGDDYLVGIQWHPEFSASAAEGLLSSVPLRDEFLHACRRQRAAKEWERVS